MKKIEVLGLQTIPQIKAGGKDQGMGQSSPGGLDELLLEDMIRWMIEQELAGWEKSIRRLYE